MLIEIEGLFQFDFIGKIITIPNIQKANRLTVSELMGGLG